MQEIQYSLPPEEFDEKVGVGETAIAGSPRNSETAVSEDLLADTLLGLEERLKFTELKATEHHDAWLRAKAETENLRRRAQEDVSKAHKFSAERFAGELLAVKDSLEAALTNEAQTAEALKTGVEITLKQLITAFEKSSVVELNPLGQKFDPHAHQSIALVDSEQEANTVVSVLQKGYALHDRILRPALVTVAKPTHTPTQSAA